MSATADECFWVCLTILWGWWLKGYHVPIYFNASHGHTQLKNRAVNVCLNLQSILLQQNCFFIVIPTCDIGWCFTETILYVGWCMVFQQQPNSVSVGSSVHSSEGLFYQTLHLFASAPLYNNKCVKFFICFGFHFISSHNVKFTVLAIENENCK